MWSDFGHFRYQPNLIYKFHPSSTVPLELYPALNRRTDSTVPLELYPLNRRKDRVRSRVRNIFTCWGGNNSYENKCLKTSLHYSHWKFQTDSRIVKSSNWNECNINWYLLRHRITRNGKYLLGVSFQFIRKGVVMKWQVYQTSARCF